MFFQKLLTVFEILEDPKHPLMGPVIKVLYCFGLWQLTGLHEILYNIFHTTTILFVLTQIVNLYEVRADINVVLDNMSMTMLCVVCVVKCFNYVLLKKKWIELINDISKLELEQIENGNSITLKGMRQYKTYTNIMACLYWILVFMTNAALIVSPFIKLLSKTYRDDIMNGVEPLPHILNGWFPIDSTRMPGYAVSITVQIIMACQGSGVVAAYDMNAVAILTYLKGQTIILRKKCTTIFDGDDITTDDVLKRMKECHRAHNLIIKHYKMFDSLLSPAMFFYVILCSVTICGGLVQFASEEASTSQKLWVVQYVSALVSQLLIYCWHSNEVTVESRKLDEGVYASQWWKGDKRLRKQTLLLASKLDNTLQIHAGPFTTLSVPTFIDMMKGSYSFFTLFSQMKD